MLVATLDGRYAARFATHKQSGPGCNIHAIAVLMHLSTPPSQNTRRREPIVDSTDIWGERKRAPVLLSTYATQAVGQGAGAVVNGVLQARLPDPAVSRQGLSPSLTARPRLLLEVDTVVEDINRFLRGWAGYFRYGNSTRMFDKIRTYAVSRLALFVAKRHKLPRTYGWKVVVHYSVNQLGLINLNGRVVAPRPNRAWRDKPNATR